MLVPCTSKKEFVQAFIRECRPQMKKKRKRLAEPDPKELRRMYLEEGMSAAQIGETYGMPDAAVRRRLKKHGIRKK